MQRLVHQFADHAVRAIGKTPPFFSPPATPRRLARVAPSVHGHNHSKDSKVRDVWRCVGTGGQPQNGLGTSTKVARARGSRVAALLQAWHALG